MIEVLIGSFLGVLGGYWSARYADLRRVRSTRLMLVTLLEEDLMQQELPFPRFEEGAVYHRHPVSHPALDALLDGERLDANTPYFLVSELTRLRTVSERYDELARVSNANQPLLLENEPYQRANYNTLKSAWEALVEARANCLKAVRAAKRGEVGKKLLGR